MNTKRECKNMMSKITNSLYTNGKTWKRNTENTVVTEHLSKDERKETGMMYKCRMTELWTLRNLKK
jgi:hypothetical protein